MLPAFNSLVPHKVEGSQWGVLFWHGKSCPALQRETDKIFYVDEGNENTLDSVRSETWTLSWEGVERIDPHICCRPAPPPLSIGLTVCSKRWENRCVVATKQLESHTRWAPF
jgi:hypothetical protein